jgi:protein-S-isoprenylcysteine O-methyltransferase Ste14
MAAFVVLIAAMPFVPARPAPLMRGLALALLLLAVLFAGLPFLQLPRFGKTPKGEAFVHTTAVARHGLYAVIRHPQYLGYDFLAWGFTTLALYWGTIIPAIVVTAGMAAQARAEEAYLVERFGDEYRAYRRTVPRFGLFTGLVRYLRRRRAEREAPQNPNQ